MFREAIEVHNYCHVFSLFSSFLFFYSSCISAALNQGVLHHVEYNIYPFFNCIFYLELCLLHLESSSILKQINFCLNHNLLF